MTKTEIYNTIKELINKADLTEEVKAEINERMDKDIAAASKKASTSKAKANPTLDALKTAILDVLGKATKPLTIPDIMASLDDFKTADGKVLTSQRVSSALTALGNGTKQKEGEHLVVRTEEKKVAYFALAPIDEDSED